MAAVKSAVWKELRPIRENRMCKQQGKVVKVVDGQHNGQATLGERSDVAVIGTGYDRRVKIVSKAQLRRERTAEHEANRARKLAAR